MWRDCLCIWISRDSTARYNDPALDNPLQRLAKHIGDYDEVF